MDSPTGADVEVKTRSSRDWAILAAILAVYAALFVAYYPPIHGIEDEVGFINQAITWSRGAISFEGAGFARSVEHDELANRARLMDFLLARGRYVPARHPGRSLILLPFVALGGVRAAFASGLLIHLCIALVGAILLHRLGRSPLWATLILAHPTLAIYCRTIMGDEAAGGLILLAALFTTVAGTRGAIAAGLVAGMAATMRYHAGLALPVVGLAIALDPARPRRLRDALACLIAGGIVGASIVAYNLMLYGSPLDPVGGPRGQFGLRFVAENLPFYATALMTLWPMMLIAPALDRSPIGRISRGVSGLFFVFFVLYYYHDRGSSLPETLVLGLRLIQPALPLWIVSYAVVVDSWIATPLRARVGPRAAMVVGLAISLGLLGSIGVAFHKHQDHLLALKSARDAITAEVPPGSLIVTQGATYKLFGVADGGPVYRWRSLVIDGLVQDVAPDIGRSRGPWFLAILVKGNAAGPAAADDLIARHRMRPVPTKTPALLLYRADPPPVNLAGSAGL